MAAFELRMQVPTLGISAHCSVTSTGSRSGPMNPPPRSVEAAGTSGVFSQRAISRLAKEGRKYGVSLCLVSQRPSELSPGSLSQCGTIFALRLSNERDQAYIKNALPDGSDWLIRTLPALGTGEAVVVGEGVTVPMQIRFDPLPREYQPASSTPSFTAAWSEEVDGARVLDGAIARWRGLQR